MTSFADFCAALKVNEAEAHELVWYLAAYRARQTVLQLTPMIKADKSAAAIVEDQRDEGYRSDV